MISWHHDLRVTFSNHMHDKQLWEGNSIGHEQKTGMTHDFSPLVMIKAKHLYQP